MKKYNREEIKKTLESGLSAKETAEKIGCSLPLVYNVATAYRIPMNGMPPILDGKDEQIVEMFNKGMTNAEIAKAFNVSEDTFRHYKKTHKLARTEEQLAKAQRDNYQNMRFSEADAASRIRTCGNVEYVSGYKNSKSTVTIRCGKCGREFGRLFYEIKPGKEMQCPHCLKEARQTREEAEAKRKAEAKAQREERERLKLLEAYQKDLAKVHDCPVCGRQTSRKKYCSQECSKKAKHQRHEVSRRLKIKKAMVDNDITLEGLYKRDNGFCHICGLKCNLEDYVVTERTIVCGDWYPSIDHVIPLSKGGTHSWSNVKLAHRGCNSWKGDRYSPQTLNVY